MILSSADVRLHIQASDWDAATKQRALALLPNLGKYTLAFLEARTTQFMSYATAPQAIVALGMCIDTFLALKKGSTEEVLQLLHDSQDNPEFDYGRFILPFVLDLKQLVRSGKISDPQVQRQLLEFEADFFQELPEEELLVILRQHLLFMVDLLDIVAEFKNIYVDRDADMQTNWSRVYLDALLSNTEQLGKTSILVDSETVAPEVHAWIKDFIVSVKRDVGTRSTFEQVQYINSSKNVAVLSATQKQYLNEILKLYTWLLHPVASATVAEENLEAELSRNPDLDVTKTFDAVDRAVPPYVPKSQAAQDQDIEISSQPKSSNIQALLGKRKPTFPTSHLAIPNEKVDIDQLRKDAEARRIAVEQDIDKKLETLKSRKGSG